MEEDRLTIHMPPGISVKDLRGGGTSGLVAQFPKSLLLEIPFIIYSLAWSLEISQLDSERSHNFTQYIIYTLHMQHYPPPCTSPMSSSFSSS
jgi:hypothetical protein